MTRTKALLVVGCIMLALAVLAALELRQEVTEPSGQAVTGLINKSAPPAQTLAEAPKPGALVPLDQGTLRSDESRPATLPGQPSAGQTPSNQTPAGQTNFRQVPERVEMTQVPPAFITPEPVRPEPVKPEQVKPEQVKPEQVKPEPVQMEATKLAPVASVVTPEPKKTEQPKPEQAKPEQAKPELVKPDQVKPEPVRPEPEKLEQPKTEPANPAQAKPQPVKPEQPKTEPTKPAQAKPEQVKPEQVKPEQVKPEQPKPEPTKPAQAKPEPVKSEQPKQETVKPELDKTTRDEKGETMRAIDTAGPISVEKGQKAIVWTRLELADKSAIFRLSGAEKVEGKAFALLDPARFVVDLEGDWAMRLPAVPKNAFIKQIRIGKYGSNTRMVLDLSRERDCQMVRINPTTLEFRIR